MANKQPIKKPSSRRSGHGSLEAPAVKIAPSDPDSLSVTITGTPAAVRHALSAVRFIEHEWNQTVARRIALEKTLNSAADLDDKLAGQKLGMEAQTVRDLYIGRCIDAAALRGHPVDVPTKLPADADTTVMEVGDALFKHARP